MINMATGKTKSAIVEDLKLTTKYHNVPESVLMKKDKSVLQQLWDEMFRVKPTQSMVFVNPPEVIKSSGNFITLDDTLNKVFSGKKVSLLIKVE